MCTIYDDDSKCFQRNQIAPGTSYGCAFDSFQDWCEECLEDWFAIIGEED